MHRFLLTATGVVGLLLAMPSWAGLTSEGCLGGSDDDLTPSAQCVYVYDDASQNGNANDSASALNSLLLFGETTWEILGKQEAGNGGFSNDSGTPNLIDLVVNANDNGLNEGTWSFNASAWNTFDPIALVMKDGNNAPAPPQAESNGFYVYLLAATNVSGDWNTDDTFGSAQLSHMSAYGVSDGGGTPPEQIPAPGLLALFGLGLLALGGVRRRS